MSTLPSPANLIDQDIFELIGLKDLSTKSKNKMIDSMVATVENRVSARILDKLSSEDIAQFQAVAEKDENKLKEFLMQRGLDLSAIFREEFLIYKAQVVTSLTGNNVTSF